MSEAAIVEEGEVLVEDKDEIRRIILDNTKSGERFSLSEIIFKFNLDLKTGGRVLDELVKEGILIERQVR